MNGRMSRAANGRPDELDGAALKATWREGCRLRAASLLIGYCFDLSPLTWGPHVPTLTANPSRVPPGSTTRTALRNTVRPLNHGPPRQRTGQKYTKGGKGHKWHVGIGIGMTWWGPGTPARLPPISALWWATCRNHSDVWPTKQWLFGCRYKNINTCFVFIYLFILYSLLRKYVNSMACFFNFVFLLFVVIYNCLINISC